MADEGLVLDHEDIAENRVQLDITPWVAEQGPDFGSAELSPYMADGTYGSTVIDGRVPNRTVTIPLQIMDWNGVTFDEFRTKLQAKVARIQTEKRGWIARTNTRVGTVYADVVNASLKLGGSSSQAYGRVDADAQLVLECLPDWYGDEVSASPAHDETTLPELVWTETGIEGDYPARCRLVVTELDGDDQLGLLWGFRSRHYSAASTARLAYEAEALTPMGTAAAASLSGASGAGSNTVQHSNLGVSWTPVLNTNAVSGGAYMTHTGTYRVYARVYSTSGSAVQLRFVWDVGDMTNPTENAAWTFLDDSQFYLADLGEIRLDATTGTHRWQGQIQAQGESGGESVRIDRLYFVPLDECAGKLRAPAVATAGIAAYSARDEFNQASGALTGKTAAVGGNWAGAGDTDDFAVETTGKTAQRSAVSDSTSGSVQGRVCTLDVNLTASWVRFDAKSTSSTGDASNHRAVARWANTNNFVYGGWQQIGNGTMLVQLVLFAAGAETVFGEVERTIYQPGVWYTTELAVLASGYVAVWVYEAGGSRPSAPTVQAFDSRLATGGSLATGDVGLYDGREAATADTRNYDNFAAWVPVGDAVAFANQSVELTTNGMFREDSAGNAYGPVSEVVGDLPRVPVSGLEGRTVEGFVLATRGDFENLPDSGIDDVRAQTFYRASWLYVPDDVGS